MPSNEQYLAALKRDTSYNPGNKKAYHNAAKTLLRRIQRQLEGYGQSDPVRSNQGGIAVSGEITLHYDHLYIQVSQTGLRDSNGVMFRTCDSRKDYSGHQNNFCDYDTLADPDAFCALVARRCKAPVQSR